LREKQEKGLMKALKEEDRMLKQRRKQMAEEEARAEQIKHERDQALAVLLAAKDQLATVAADSSVAPKLEHINLFADIEGSERAAKSAKEKEAERRADGLKQMKAAIPTAFFGAAGLDEKTGRAPWYAAGKDENDKVRQLTKEKKEKEKLEKLLTHGRIGGTGFGSGAAGGQQSAIMKAFGNGVGGGAGGTMVSVAASHVASSTDVTSVIDAANRADPLTHINELLARSRRSSLESTPTGTASIATAAPRLTYQPPVVPTSARHSLAAVPGFHADDNDDDHTGRYSSTTSSNKRKRTSHWDVDASGHQLPSGTVASNPKLVHALANHMNVIHNGATAAAISLGGPSLSASFAPASLAITDPTAARVQAALERASAAASLAATAMANTATVAVASLPTAPPSSTAGQSIGHSSSSDNSGIEHHKRQRIDDPTSSSSEKSSRSSSRRHNKVSDDDDHGKSKKRSHKSSKKHKKHKSKDKKDSHKHKKKSSKRRSSSSSSSGSDSDDNKSNTSSSIATAASSTAALRAERMAREHAERQRATLLHIAAH
jgi:hypothetical protein